MTANEKLLIVYAKVAQEDKVVIKLTAKDKMSQVIATEYKDTVNCPNFTSALKGIV